MPWDGNGNVIRSNGTNTGGQVWEDDKSADIKIRADLHDAHDQDLAGAIEECLNRNGENTMADNLKMGGFKLVNAGEGTAADEMATVGQAQRNTLSVAQAAGTDALTASFAPTIVSLEDQLTLYVRAAAANTSTTPTFSPNGLAAKTIVKNGNEALIPGDIHGQYHVLILQYRLTDDVWELLNPASHFPSLTGDVTATEAELNRLDGISVSTEELNSSVKHNFASTAAPGSSDDTDSGYSVGSRWLNTITEDTYVCVDDSSGAAVWEYTSAGRIAEGASGAPRIVYGALNLSNDIQQSDIASGAVGQGELQNNAVGQGQINTGVGSVSSSNTTGINRTFPGGDFGFYPIVRTSLPFSGNEVKILSSHNTSGIYVTNIFLLAGAGSGGTTGTVYARQRYVQSSPPYDLGDGECGLFVEVDVRPHKRIGGVYAAPDPVWSNNGPTDIRPDWTDRKTGKKYKRIRRPALCRSDLESGKCDMADYIAAQKEAPIEDVEIDGAYKNADMGLIPHSWASDPQGTICLLDPVNTHDLLALHEAGEDIADLIHKGYIKLGDPCNRCGPPGVTVISWSFK